MNTEKDLKIGHVSTYEQAKNDLEWSLLGGERPAHKVIALACKALEEQIPQKMILKTNIFFDCYFCPRCGTQLQQKARCVDIAHLTKSNYCHTCGQALDWEGIENDKIK